MERTRTHKSTEAARRRRGALIRNGTAAAAFAVLAVLFITACPNSVTPPPQGNTGRITVSFNIAGTPITRTASQARTLHPLLDPSPFTKYELTFTATSGGEAHAPVVVTGGTGSINLVVGTYTITATAFIGDDPSYTTVAGGTATGVTVSASGNTGVNITLGPITGGADGTFSYDISLTDITPDEATLTITDLSNSQVGSEVTLNPGPNTGTIDLAPGYYYVWVYLEKDSKYAGLTEVIHIYTGLTSALPALTYTLADFAAVVAVSASDLSGLFAAPAAGVAPVTSFAAPQYAGTIVWSPAVSGNFAPATPYTATLTLAATPGYTFDGVAANFFTHSGATSVTNAANTGVATIVFPATASAQGSQDVSWGLIDYTDIPVTNYTEPLTLTKGGASLTLSVTGYDDVAWYLDGKSAAAATGASITLDPDDYSVKTHTLTVQATKDGVPFARVLKFSVAEGSGSGGAQTPVALADLADYITALPANTVETPHTVVLAAGPSDGYFSATNIDTLKTALAQSKYIALDIRGVVFPDNTTLSGQYNTPTTSHFNYFANEHIVEVMLPTMIVGLDADAFNGFSGLKRITIPASVTTILAAFDRCTALTEVTFLSANVSVLGASFSPSIKSAYNNGGAGTYVKSSNVWSKQS
jgi:hypothetical protein